MRKKSNALKKAKPAKGAKSGARGSNWATKLVQDVWPQERDFVERPERYRYVRKLLPESDKCVFCEGQKAGANAHSLLLAKDEHCMIFMNKYPYNTGHLLILPIEHEGDIQQIPDAVLSGLMKWIQVATDILKKEMNCQGFNVGLNLGAVAGAGIPGHLHWHVIPRWGGDTNFYPLIAETKALPESIEQTYARLKPHFEAAL